MPSSSPLVSIIIPTYNRAHLIGETLDSVLAQTYQNWECIVVDDGSTDGTDEVMAAYMGKDTRFQYHHRPKDRLPGGNAARNYGFEVSKGEYIQWFDSDDLMLPEYLSFRIPLFEDKTEVLICAGYIVNENIEIQKQIYLNTNIDLYKEYGLWRFEMYTPSVLFKKSFLKLGLFNEIISRGQETEFFTRIFYNLPIYKYVIIDKPLFYYRQHVSSKSERAREYNKKFRDDLLFILQSNFIRSLQLVDADLVYFYYKRLIKQFFKSVQNNHLSNSRKVLYFLIWELNNRNLLLKVKLFIYGGVYVLFKRGYMLQSKLLNHNLRF